MNKSRSFPERLYDSAIREHHDQQLRLDIQAETLEKYKEKDHERTEQLANIGSPSSRELKIVVHLDWRAKCCQWVSTTVNYFLEREDETRLQDEILQSKSYAGFYYFIKWFVRSLFFLVFTTLGTISGKEVGCAIKDHDTCKSSAIELVSSSPHLVASIIGSVFGLLIGQWIGRYMWDNTTRYIQRCLRKTEKLADNSKAFLFIISTVIYITITTAFATIFFFFVNIHQDDDNIIGAVIGGFIGLICAICAYRKSSTCQTGQRTPMVKGTFNYNEPEVLRI